VDSENRKGIEDLIRHIDKSRGEFSKDIAAEIIKGLKEPIEQIKPRTEDKAKRIDEINFAMHELTDNTALTITIIIGIFGVLTLFNFSDGGAQNGQTGVQGLHQLFSSKPELWWWKLGRDTILSVVYWTLILFGLKCYVDRRIFFIFKDDLIEVEGIPYNTDLKDRVKGGGKLTNASANYTWAKKKPFSGQKKNLFSYKAHLGVFTLFYLTIAFFLWFFIANPLQWFIIH
jgi:hypothetical protein